MGHVLFPLAGLASFLLVAAEIVHPSPPAGEEVLLSRYQLALYLCYRGDDTERRDHWCRKADQKLGELRARGYPI